MKPVQMMVPQRMGRPDEARAIEEYETLPPRGLTGLDTAMLGLLALMVGCHAVAALLNAGWATALMTDALASAYVLALVTHRAWRPLLARLLVLGLIAGFLELATDAAGAMVARSLVYPMHEPMLWASPAYMPFSWMIVVTLLGYLAWRLRTAAPRMPLWLVCLLTGVWGAVNIGFYEETAYYAGWWHYTPTALTLGHAPLYVPVFEGIVAAALPLLLGVGLPYVGWRSVALRGAALGAWMPLAALSAWLLLGR